MRISDWSSDVCSSDLASQPIDPKPKSARRRVALAFVAAGVVVAATAALYSYAPRSIAFVRSDNSYVKGDVTFISSKLAGYVTKLAVDKDKKTSEERSVGKEGELTYSNGWETDP